ncbi:MAG: ATP-grasp domain-containing protein [Candidatus Nanoarchaeia archaeon]|jgi:hypothetical protein|nr:ATP-grasp domain-containing protein [Candidatus Nanoarchaeia archaeon]
MYKVLIYGDKIPQTVDCSIAFHGFEELACDITVFRDWLCFNKEEFEKFDVCVGGVNLCHWAFLKLGIKNYNISCYPEQLKDFFHREINQVEVKKVIKEYPRNKFLKPIRPKQFQAFTTKKMFNSKNISLINLEEHEKIYVSELVDFKSEWRVYVNSKEIRNICFYKGDCCLLPDIKTIRTMIKVWKTCPCCYALDVGIVYNYLKKKFETILVEINDFYSIGNYGLESVEYAKMLYLRWKEICSLHVQ